MGRAAIGQQYRSLRDHPWLPSVPEAQCRSARRCYSTVTLLTAVWPRRTFWPSITPIDWMR
jgi:hypothetical protein